MAAAQQQGQGGDNSLAPVWIIVLLFLVGMAVWYFFHSYIVMIVFQLKYYEGWLMSWFTSSIDPVLDLLKVAQPSQVSFDDMLAVSTAVGNYFRYPVIGILLVLAVILYRSDITSQFKNIYSTKSLLKAEAVNWPQITPVVNLDLINEDVTKGPWAMAMSPLEFSQQYHLLKIETYPDEHVRKTGEFGRYLILKGEAKRIFTMQLGDYWEGPDALPPHTKALLAAFMAKNQRDRKGCNDLLLQINRSTADGKLNFSGADALIKKHGKASEIQKIFEKHAYVTTVMASMLEASRKDGVFPSSDFLWLKPVDRRLWFLLNTIGRQTPFSEVAGPFAHWIAERKLGRKLLVPMVDEAVNGLEAAVQEIKYVPKNPDEV